MKLKSRIISAAIASVFMTSITAIITVSAAELATFNVANGTAVIDGVVSPGEWDNATAMQVSWADCHDGSSDGENGGGNTIFPQANVPKTDDGFAVTAKLKVDDDYLYLMEDRVSNNQIVFCMPDASFSFNESGGLIFFQTSDGRQYNIFYAANTSTNSGPSIANRAGWGDPQAIPITDSNLIAVSVCTANHTILEAKIPLKDIVDTDGTSLTKADFADGMKIGWPIDNVWDPEFSTTAWQWSDDPQRTGFYQINWPFAGGFVTVPVATVADDFDPASVTAATKAEADTTAAEDNTITAAAPATGDNNFIYIILSLLGLSAASVTIFALRKKPPANKAV